MKDNQLEKMSVKELRDLKARIDSAISQRQSKDRAELKQKMILLAEEAGLSLDDVIGGRRGTRTKGTVAVKYRHPDDASLTWTGRGRRPRWLDGIANIEKFRV